MLGLSPALLTQSPSGFTVSQDPLGLPVPRVQETVGNVVRTLHRGLGCGQIWSLVDAFTSILGKVQISIWICVGGVVLCVCLGLCDWKCVFLCPSPGSVTNMSRI